MFGCGEQQNASLLSSKLGIFARELQFGLALFE
jgi:hypothetical protein